MNRASKTIAVFFVIGVVFGLFALASCGSASRTVANFTGRSEVCVDHVVVLQFPSGVVYKRTIDDKLVAC